MINLDQCQCCAVQEMDSLDEYENDPKQAMLDFCKQLRGYRGVINDPGAFIVFTSIVKNRGYDPDNDDEIPQLPRYGQQFATYIKTNQLGTLIQTKPGYNRRNEPNHLIKVWVWSPDYEALKVWWSTNRPKKAGDVL